MFIHLCGTCKRCTEVSEDKIHTTKEVRNKLQRGGGRNLRAELHNGHGQVQENGNEGDLTAQKLRQAGLLVKGPNPTMHALYQELCPLPLPLRGKLYSSGWCQNTDLAMDLSVLLCQGTKASRE